MRPKSMPAASPPSESMVRPKATPASASWLFFWGIVVVKYFFVQLCFFYCLNVMCVDDSDILYFIYVLLSVLELTTASAPGAVVAWFLRW